MADSRTLSVLGSLPLPRPFRYNSLFLGTHDLSEWFIKIVFTMPMISSSPKSGSLADCIFTADYISFGRASKMIVVKRLSVTVSSRSSSSSRSWKTSERNTSGSTSDLNTLLSNRRNSVLLRWRDVF